MKISVKLTVLSVIITAIAVILCCTILLITAADNQINHAVQSGVTELRMFNNAFNAEMDVVGDGQMSETAKRSLILYVFRKYTDASVNGSRYVLTDTEQTMSNNSPIDPRPLLPGLKENAARSHAQYDDDASLWPNVIAESDGRRYLIVGHWAPNLGGQVNFPHEIFLVQDITNVYDGMGALGARFALIALVTVITSASVMILVIRSVMRPLGKLKKSAVALAGGRYDTRIEVQGRDEIAELGTSFNRMADAISDHIDALKYTAEQRRLLISALTHELKTPMTAIIGYSDALLRVHLGKAQREESIAYIHSECKRIETLTQKMMQLIALQGGEPVDLKPHPIRELYDTVGMTLRGIARREDIALSLVEKGSPVVAMDMDMMASVIINLFDNACKAGAKHITIEAEGQTICVRDDGAGIPADEIGKITQPFYMVAASHSQSAGGSGLGLALCDLILKAHRAKLHIESLPGQGTTVIISFEKLHFDNTVKNT